MKRIQLSALSPLTKIGCWLGLVVVLATVLQSVTWMLGLPFNIMTNAGGGRGVLIAIALASLLAMMAADKRPISEFGLFVGPQWKKLWFGGLGVGVITYGAYLGLAIALGVFQWNTASLTPGKLGKAVLAGMAVFPLALTQQILFNGYFLSMLRERYQRVTAVLVSAFLFAILGKLHAPHALLRVEGQMLVIGLFFVGVLLGVLRLKTGNIVLPAGLLAGWLLVRRLVRKTSLLVPVTDTPNFWWVSPHGDTRTAPLMWLLLATAAAACWYVLWRRGEAEVPKSMPALDADFKKIFPFSHGNCLTPLDVWIRCLIAARFRVGLKYVPKLLFALTFSTINTVLSLPERILLPLLLKRRSVEDPLFVLGVHRSGTTHLHNLLALDPQFCTPRVYHILNPVGCRISGWLIAPLMAAFMPWKRPMDSVRFHLFAPQEDEFMMSGVSHMSPYWGMAFPRMWKHFDRYIYPDRLPPREQAAWKRHYMSILRTVTSFHDGRPLLKTPYNTGRTKTFREMFPAAQFIHIYRDPYTVYRSNMHLAREGHVVNQLQDPDPDTSYQSRFLDNYRELEETFYNDVADLPQDCVVEVCFEDLERNPIGEIRRIYDLLGLQFTLLYQQRLVQYLDGLADYQKNRHRDLPEDTRAEIDAQMGEFMIRWGYAETPIRRRVA